MCNIGASESTLTRNPLNTGIKKLRLSGAERLTVNVMLQKNKKMQSCVQSQHPPTLRGITGRKKKEKEAEMEIKKTKEDEVWMVIGWLFELEIIRRRTFGTSSDV